MGGSWLDVIVGAACFLIAVAVAYPPARIRRLRSGAWAIVRLRRQR